MAEELFRYREEQADGGVQVKETALCSQCWRELAGSDLNKTFIASLGPVTEDYAATRGISALRHSVYSHSRVGGQRADVHLRIACDRCHRPAEDQAEQP